MMNGKLIIFSAPSGSGKTTIVNRIKDKFNLEFSISATTRPRRKTEVHGFDYIFLSVEDFKADIDAGLFLEYEEVYPGKYYGTLLIQVDNALNAGKHLIFDVDVVGGLNIKKHYVSKALALFIQAPSIAELELRLNRRGTDSEEVIKERIAKAQYEMTFASQFDHIITNDNLDQALLDTEKIITAFLNT